MTTYYKYRPINKYTRKLIKDSVVWFSKVAAFNDPFDCRQYIDFNFTNAEWDLFLKEFGLPSVNLSDEQKASLFDYLRRHHEAMVEQSSVFCMSKKKDDILMFSHYADNHRGCVLEFTASTDTLLGRAVAVDYTNKIPSARYAGLRNSSVLAEKVFLTKSRHWKYEQEVRTVRYKRSEGLVTFPKECLTAIYFGCKTPPSDMRKVMNWCRKWSNPNIKFFRGELLQKRFGIKFRPIDYRDVSKLSK